MVKGTIYLFIASMSLSTAGIIFTDYTTTPAESFDLTQGDTMERAKVIGSFLSSILDDYDPDTVNMSIIIEGDHEDKSIKNEQVRES